ncbi:MAG: hypothetical protein ACLQEQ_01600 [Nitrososphaerales archaeon]
MAVEASEPLDGSALVLSDSRLLEFLRVAETALRDRDLFDYSLPINRMPDSDANLNGPNVLTARLSVREIRA